MDTMAFGDRLKDAMELRDLTQGQVEARTEQLGRKVSQSHISRLLRSEQDPTLDVARVLALALHISLDWLAEIPRTEDAKTDEDELLASYRRILDGRAKRMILDMVKAGAHFMSR